MGAEWDKARHCGVPGGIRTHDPLLRRQPSTFKLLNNLTVTELAELSNLSKAYISQVKSGKRPPSQKLIDLLVVYAEPKRQIIDYYTIFLESRKAIGASEKTLRFYRQRLSQFITSVDYHTATRQTVERFLNQIPPNSNGLGTRHASFRAIKTFYRWLQSEYGYSNPIDGLSAPILGKVILPSLTIEQVWSLIDQSVSLRDKAIIALFTESGLRLSELANIKLQDIDWEAHTIRTIGKGRKEAYAPFGELSERYMKAWLAEFTPVDNIWGINAWGISIMLRRLKEKTGLPCNPHTFRRTFACLLRKAGLDTMTIKDLGRWESLEMVQRYTRSVTFQDSMKFYKAPLG